MGDGKGESRIGRGPIRLEIMFRWIARQYARRIVNINVNIVVAGLLAIVLTAIPLNISRHLGVTDDHKFTILVITFVSDYVIDLFISVGLHWLANHWPRKLKGRGLIQRAEEVVESAPPPLPFVKDTTMIQLQRACLSPLLYVIALGMQWLLLHQGLGRETAAISGFATGILVCRVVHTIWLLRIDRRHWAEWEAQRTARIAELQRKRAEAEHEEAERLAQQSRLALQRAEAHCDEADRLKTLASEMSQSSREQSARADAAAASTADGNEPIPAPIPGAPGVKPSGQL